LKSNDVDWPAIVREHGPTVWKTALPLLLNEADVADCFQETFVSALQYAVDTPVANWPALLRRIAISRALDLLRTRKRQRAVERIGLSDDLPSREPDPLLRGEATELGDRLRLALVELPPAQGQAFCLRHFSGLEYEEIATEMRVTTDAAGALLHRARARLGELLLGAATTKLTKVTP
jgi:RNA polymerase sigma-70 factor, ECF subfamily